MERISNVRSRTWPFNQGPDQFNAVTGTHLLNRSLEGTAWNWNYPRCNWVKLVKTNNNLRLKPGIKTRLPKGPMEEIFLKYEMAGKNYALWDKSIPHTSPLHHPPPPQSTANSKTPQAPDVLPAPDTPLLPFALELSTDAPQLGPNCSFSKPVTETIWATCTTHTLAPENPISHSGTVLQALGEHEEAPVHRGRGERGGDAELRWAPPRLCCLAFRLSQDAGAAPSPWGLRAAPQLWVPRLLPSAWIHRITVGSDQAGPTNQTVSAGSVSQGLPVVLGILRPWRGCFRTCEQGKADCWPLHREWASPGRGGPGRWAPGSLRLGFCTNRSGSLPWAPDPKCPVCSYIKSPPWWLNWFE